MHGLQQRCQVLLKSADNELIRLETRQNSYIITKNHAVDQSQKDKYLLVTQSTKGVTVRNTESRSKAIGRYKKQIFWPLQTYQTTVKSSKFAGARSNGTSFGESTKRMPDKCSWKQNQKLHYKFINSSEFLNKRNN